MKVMCNGCLSLVQSTSYLNTGWKVFLQLWVQMIFLGILAFLEGVLTFPDSLSVFFLEMMLHYVLRMKSNATCSAFWEWYCLYTGTTVIGMSYWRMNVLAKQNIKITILRSDGSLVLHCMEKAQMHYSFFVFFSSVAYLKLWRSKTYLCILTDNGTTFHSLTVIQIIST